MTATGDAFQRVADLIVVEHPVVAPHADIVGIAVVDCHDSADGHTMFALRIVFADFVNQIAVDGRTIGGQLFIDEHHLLVLVFLVEDDDGNRLDAERLFLARFHPIGVKQRVAFFLHFQRIDFRRKVGHGLHNSQHKLLAEVNRRRLAFLAHCRRHPEEFIELLCRRNLRIIRELLIILKEIVLGYREGNLLCCIAVLRFGSGSLFAVACCQRYQGSKSDENLFHNEFIFL